MNYVSKCLLVWIMVGGATAQAAQVKTDRTDPALITRNLPIPTDQPQPLDIPAQPAPAEHVALAETAAVKAISIRGSDIPAGAFDAATRPFLGRALLAEDLSALASAVADVARQRGLVFASASIPAQRVTDDTLVVTVDTGRVDAVRSLGMSNPAADRLLSKLVTHAGVTKDELERTLLLVGDLPGLTVTGARYARENGFGVLLVTVALKKTSLYAQFDNRGTDEIGPWRTTELASVRSLATAGDEFSFVASQTPLQPREFQFFSAQYGLPVGKSGDRASVSAFFGATHAGADLTYLDLTGKTYGAAIDYSVALQRTKAASFWLDLDLHTIRNQQDLRGLRFRTDSITVASATLRTTADVGGGVLRGGLTTSVGLPVLGATHAGDPSASRDDGDARFVTESFQADWTRHVVGVVSLQLDMAGQVASRPLLATAEISLGGPTFGRAYDYSERTGDQGLLGSAEAQFDLRTLGRGVFSKAQAYIFVDGGSVGNLDNGVGGGTLFSSGGGLRLGLGRLNGSFELAFPINADRFDTGSRAPRVSTSVFVFF